MNEQLQEAYKLAKSGQKGRALTLTKNVLRDDRQNIDAWLLMANLVDDDNKVVKSLEEVLRINPQHKAAQRRLNQLRPQKGQAGFARKSILNKEKNDAASSGGSNRGLLIGGVIVILLLLVGVGIFFFAINNNSAPTATPTPARRPVSLGNEVIRETISIAGNSYGELTIPDGGVYTIVARGEGRFDPIIEVYNGEQLLARSTNNIGVDGLDTFDAAVRYLRVEGGSTIQISESSRSGGSATVIVAAVDATQIQEIVSINEVRTISFEGNTGYEFAIQDNANIRITADREISVDPVLAVYNEFNELIAYNDDHFTDDPDLTLTDAVITNVRLRGWSYIHIRDTVGDFRNVDAYYEGTVTITIEPR